MKNTLTGKVKNYCPEIGEKQPKAQMFASLSYYGNHYFIYSKILIKENKSIKYLGTTLSNFFKNELCYEYKVTTKGYNDLKNLYVIGKKELLD